MRPAEQSRIWEFLAYDPDTGIITWKAKPKGRGYPFKVGDVAGAVRGDGRCIIGFDGRQYLRSRMAWLFIHGDWPPEGKIVDHRNVDPGDDRAVNLRLATQGQNMLNTRSHADSKSKFKGVWWHKRIRKWAANFRSKHLGLFETEKDAALAYDIEASAHSPEFSRLNFSEGAV